eukprot:gnl/Spiro4/10770_TR5738_c0_g1_i1.p1 gnl/Spiro4/10770_TR5738_c0_g1~~gnl/Spiro4/10770_TR5738_c0_g1_i1.p1  ORF type:complete len:246 (+),score=21.84 gnl/Spiro4/10770_TR5738_c0_g1_i1:58-795(+)
MFSFPIVGEVPRLPHDSPVARDMLAAGQPCILEGTNLVQSAIENWTVEYIARAVPLSFRCMVCVKPTQSDRTQFLHEDPSASFGYGYVPKLKRLEMPLVEFFHRLRDANATESVYMQQELSVLRDKLALGALAADISRFRHDFITDLARSLHWANPATPTNLLFVGPANSVTPCHYDLQHNLFAQIRGRKRVLLFSPSNFSALYPFPVFHPCDRQSQVDFYAPWDADRFPLLPHARAISCVLREL